MESKSITTDWRVKFDRVMADYLINVKNSADSETLLWSTRRDCLTEYQTLDLLIKNTNGMCRSKTILHFADALHYQENIQNDLRFGTAIRHDALVALKAIEHVLMHRILRTAVLDSLYDHLTTASN